MTAEPLFRCPRPRRSPKTATPEPQQEQELETAQANEMAETLSVFFKEFRNEPAARAVADRLLERLKQKQMSSRQELCPTCGNKTKPPTKKQEKSRK